MIDHATIERILDAAQITDVVQEFVPLKKPARTLPVS
jgi:DNA primase